MYDLLCTYLSLLQTVGILQLSRAAPDSREEEVISRTPRAAEYSKANDGIKGSVSAHYPWHAATYVGLHCSSDARGRIELTLCRSDSYDVLVTVKVGPPSSQKTYQLYQGVLSHFSGYFKARKRSKSRENIIELRMESADVFDLFKCWLYTAKMTPLREEDMNCSFKEIVRVYAFARRTAIPALKNHALNILAAKIVNEAKTSGLADLIYSNTGTGDHLRRFWTQVWAKTGPLASERFMGEVRETWYLEALQDLIEVLLTNPKHECPEEILNWDLCAYHEHEEGERCST